MLQSVSGVDRAEVVFKDRKAYIWGTANAVACVDAVKSVGFGAEAVMGAAMQEFTPAADTTV